MKNITGAADWKTTPDISLATTDDELEAIKQNIPNIVVNGGFEIWQRGNSFVNPSSADLTADKWFVTENGSPTWTISKESSAANRDNGLYSLKMDITNIGTSTYLYMQNRLADPAKYRGKTLSISVRVKTSVSNVKLRLNDGITGTREGGYLLGRSIRFSSCR